jgi:hypothetical protein
MAEMAGVSRTIRGGGGWLSGTLAAIGAMVRRLRPVERASRLNPEEWPDYLLKDIGLPNAARGGQDPRALPLEWRLR